MSVERRDSVKRPARAAQPDSVREEVAPTAKPFVISKHQVVEAFRLVKANAGSAGVDKQSIAAFEENLKDNMYKLWNRMSSGSYFPPPVKAVPVPKKSGGERILGVPTVSDRIAQMVVKLEFEPAVEPHFLPDSYGYRPGKSALDAVGVTRKRCWDDDWVVEFDIKGLFDNIPHDLILGFTPAVSRTSLKAMRMKIRKSRMRARTDLSLNEIADWLNPIMRGWLAYYGRYTRSAMYAIVRHVNKTLGRWAMRKFKLLGRGKFRATAFFERCMKQSPGLFVHWREGMKGAFA
jgi:hypothetical protein